MDFFNKIKGLFNNKKIIKGNVSRDGKKIYYTPEHRLYESVNAEFLFDNVEEAESKGFRAPKK